MGAAGQPQDNPRPSFTLPNRIGILFTSPHNNALIAQLGERAPEVSQVYTAQGRWFKPGSGQ